MRDLLRIVRNLLCLAVLGWAVVVAYESTEEPHRTPAEVRYYENMENIGAE